MDGDLAGNLSPRIQGIGTSQIGLVADRGRDDPDVIKLWIGEGDLPTPDFITAAAHAAMQAGHTRYTYSLGLPRLHQALSDYHRRHWGVEVAPDRFAVTAGGMNAIMQISQALLEPGDEAIIPSPSWPNGAEAMRVGGAVPVPVPYRTRSDGRFGLDLGDIEAALTDRTRLIVINSPSNPTGWVMPLAEMAALRDLARARGLWILADEVYAHFTYGNAIAPSFLQICTDTDRLIVSNTFSKNWAMTGWRAGWLVYPQGLGPVFAKLGQYNTTSIPTFIQHAAVTALDEGDGFIRTMVGRCAESRAILVDGLSRVPGVTVSPPDGAFYLMARVAEPASHPGESSLELAFRLLVASQGGRRPRHGVRPRRRGLYPDLFRDQPGARAGSRRAHGSRTRVRCMREGRKFEATCHRAGVAWRPVAPSRPAAH